VAEDAAVLYSMMECFKARGVNFLGWFIYFLEKMHSYNNDFSKDIVELLPHNFKSQNSAV